jgi:hypothetical protein
MLWQMFRTHTYFAAFVMALAGTAAVDPKSPQCWDCLQRLAMGLPAVNAQEDPSYEQGLTPGSVSPGLAQCSLDDGKIPTLRQIINILTDAQAEHGGAAYAGLFNAQYMTRMARIALMPPKAMRCRPSETL